ncbi:uncharacterized protein LOC114291950 [Camellia sinensis]|uniref:uncharacterized protein LOC114291950 n=1 Tax=Camellia sinensis TaxID=4442 RepID=UPI00103606CF|nr:uncharacterized protein LOC114291950 [Camellia sinensis]
MAKIFVKEWDMVKTLNEFRIQIESQDTKAYLSAQKVMPKLMNEIMEAQKHDKEVAYIKGHLESGEPMLNWVIHPDGSLSYQGRLFVPSDKLLREKNEQTVHSTSEGSLHKVLELTEIYKPSVHVNPIFASVGTDTSKLYSASEATDVVFKYIEQENLIKPTNKSIVILDAALCDALYKGTIKKGSTYPTEIHKKDLGHTFINRMQPHHRVTRGSESVVRKGALKTIQIMTERRQGNKKVTKLSGMESFLMDAEALASELQKKFACSTSVAKLPGKKGHEVLIQGGVIDDLGRHLVEQYGVPKRYIEVLDKTRK